MIDSTLRANRGFHQATAADNRHVSLPAFQHDRHRLNPYLLEADVDGDGDLDLIFTLAGDSSAQFRVYLALAEPGRLRAPEVIGEAEWLARGAVFWTDGHLALGELYSDVIFNYRWDPATSRLEVISPPSEGPFTSED